MAKLDIHHHLISLCHTGPIICCATAQSFGKRLLKCTTAGDVWLSPFAQKKEKKQQVSLFLGANLTEMQRVIAVHKEDFFFFDIFEPLKTSVIKNASVLCLYSSSLH